MLDNLAGARGEFTGGIVDQQAVVLFGQKEAWCQGVDTDADLGEMDGQPLSEVAHCSERPVLIG